MQNQPRLSFIFFLFVANYREITLIYQEAGLCKSNLGFLSFFFNFVVN